MSERFKTLLRSPFAAQRLAVMGIVKRWHRAKAVDRRAMLQPRDPKSTGPREVLEPIETEVAQVEQRQRPCRGDLLGDWVGSVAEAPGVIRSCRIEPVRSPTAGGSSSRPAPRKMPPQPGNWSASSSGSAMVLLSPMRTLVNLFSRSTV